MDTFHTLSNFQPEENFEFDIKEGVPEVFNFWPTEEIQGIQGMYYTNE